MSAPSKEEMEWDLVAEAVSEARRAVADGEPMYLQRAIVAVANAYVRRGDENERLRAERAECLELLEEVDDVLGESADIISDWRAGEEPRIMSREWIGKYDKLCANLLRFLGQQP